MEFLNSNDYSIFWGSDHEGPTEEVTLCGQSPEELTEPAKRPQEEAAARPWNLAYYYCYFDVTTTEVLARVAAAMFPSPFGNFSVEVVKNKADLFGPFWIGITLATAIGVTSDLAYSLVPSALKLSSTLGTMYAAYVLIFLYSWCLPTCLWVVFEWYSTSDLKFGLSELICVYGYAIAAYLPNAFFWFLPVWWLKLTTATMGVCISGITICRALRAAIQEMDKVHYVAVLSLLFATNAFVGYNLCFLFYPAVSFQIRNSTGVSLSLLSNHSDAIVANLSGF